MVSRKVKEIYLHSSVPVDRSRSGLRTHHSRAGQPQGLHAKDAPSIDASFEKSMYYDEQRQVSLQLRISRPSTSQTPEHRI